MKYAWATIKHKWFVLVAGLKIGCPIWRLIKHDWTKFLPCELPHYQRQFFGKKDDEKGFQRCWLHHQNSNDHHWEYWVPRKSFTVGAPAVPDEPIMMPEDAIREMVADWMGASRAYEGKWPDLFLGKENTGWRWFEENFHKIRLHNETRARVLGLLLEIQHPELVEG